MDNQNPQSTPPIQTPPIESSPTQQVPPQASKSFLSNKLIIIAIILVIILLVGGGGYFVLNSKSKSQPVISKTTPTPTPISTYALPTDAPTPTIATNSATVEQNGIRMTISPTHGPVGTKVKISIVGIIGNPNAPYAGISFQAKNGPSKDNNSFDTTKISQNGVYETPYIIPNIVLTIAHPGDQNPTKEIPIETGDGNVLFTYNHPTLHDIAIYAPFTVTPN